MQMATPPFDFDCLGNHYSHCFYSPKYSTKDPAYMTLSKLILAKFERDPSLSTLIALATTHDSQVPPLPALYTFKANELTSFVNKQILERLADRQLVRQALTTSGEAALESSLGKRD